MNKQCNENEYAEYVMYILWPNQAEKIILNFLQRIYLQVLELVFKFQNGKMKFLVLP